MRKVQGRQVLAPMVAMWILLAAAGCGSNFKLVPVSGKVTLDGKPLRGGGVNFVPDAAKGSTHRVGCAGRIDGQGHFHLTTSSVQASESGPGAPTGWYKVTLMTTLPGSPEIEVPARYLDVAQTPLAVEVVANPEPDAYNIGLTSQ